MHIYICLYICTYNNNNNDVKDGGLICYSEFTLSRDRQTDTIQYDGCYCAYKQVARLKPGTHALVVS